MFDRDLDYHVFRECLRYACERHGCSVHAYVLMTNHVHLLMTPHREASISKAMQSVGQRFVRYANDVRGRTGTLLEGRYRSAPIDSVRYLLACYRYIELNPVRARMVESPVLYRWSSHPANAFGAIDPLVTPHEYYAALAPDAFARQAAYRALFAVALDDSTVGEIRDASRKGWALGSKRFRDQISATGQRRAAPLSRGRPRKTGKMGSDPNFTEIGV